MRIPAEIAVILFLLFLGWRQSYREHLSHLFPDQIPPRMRAMPASLTPAPEPSDGRDRSR